MDNDINLPPPAPRRPRPRPSIPSSTPGTTSDFLLFLLAALGTLTIFYIFYRIYHSITHKPKTDLENIAEKIQKLPAHAQLIIGNAPLNTNNTPPNTNNAPLNNNNARPQPSPLSDDSLTPRQGYDPHRDYIPPPPPPTARGLVLPASDGRRAIAGWTGLRYGVILGLGIGVVGCGGYVSGTAPLTTVLAMAIWCMCFQAGGANYATRSDDPGMEAEIRLLEYQAVVFGTVLGVGFGVVLGLGLWMGFKLHWVAVGCVGWALVWGMLGGGVTWVCEERRLRLEWVFIGGLGGSVGRFVEMVGGKFRLRFWWVLCGLVGAVIAVAGSGGRVWWVLCGLVAAVMAVVGFGGPPSSPVGQGSRTEPGPPLDGTPDGGPPFDGRPDGGPPSDGSPHGGPPSEGPPDGDATERGEVSGTPADSENSWVNESPGDQLQEDDGAPGGQLREDDEPTALEDPVRAESPPQADRSIRRRTTSRGKLTREMTALGLNNERVDDGGLGG